MRRLQLCLIGVLAFGGAIPTRAAEMRGLWVDAFHPGFKSATETSAMVTKAKECNFNALFVQVRKRGDVYYSSAIEPRAHDIAPGYDPLADVVSKAHANGLEVHAWIAVYEVYHDTKWNTTDPRQVHARHPEWLMKDVNGKYKFPGDKVYLDPGLPEVQAYLIGIIDELVRNYDVDGIHLDIARYPGREGGYNDGSIALFNQETSRTGIPEPDDEAWCNWRRRQVTNLVRGVYQTAVGIRSRVKVSAAVFTNKSNAMDDLFQDWEGWLRAGILDSAVPMAFAKDNRVFRSTTQEMVASGNGRHIYIGQGGWKMSAANSLEQIQLVRTAGAEGTVIYSYHYCSRVAAGASGSLMDALKAGPFSQPDTVPILAWK